MRLRPRFSIPVIDGEMAGAETLAVPARAQLIARFVLVCILALAAVLIFANLGTRFLWDDEAETALLARNVLRSGLPLGWDGRDLISQECGIELDENYVARRHGWFPIYLVAASFKLLGADTMPARLPSAVLGWLSVLSTYVLARRIFRDQRTALLSAALLTVSVPFLLYVRQSRYYAAAIFATIWAVFFFLAAMEGRRFAWLGLALSLVLMFHSLIPMAVGAVLAFAIVFALDRHRQPVAQLLIAAGLTVGLTVPWLLIYGLPWMPSFATGASAGAWAPLVGWTENLAFYLAAIDRRVLPLLVPVTLVAGLYVTRGRRTLDAPPAGRGPRLLLVFAVVYLLFVAVYPQPFFRYVVSLLPVLALLTAWLATRLWKINRLVAVAALLVIATTDVLHGRIVFFGPSFRSFTTQVRSPLLSYLDEITSHDQGPIEAIVRHLRQAARPGERLFISYGDLPLRFYTDLEIRGGQGCQSLSGWSLPDWLVIRYFVTFRQDGAPPRHHENRRLMHEYIGALPQRAYQAIELPVVDTIWENIPEPGHHTFRAPTDGPRVVIHRRIDRSADERPALSDGTARMLSGRR
jgi:hypothetical protein